MDLLLACGTAHTSQVWIRGETDRRILLAWYAGRVSIIVQDWTIKSSAS